MRNSQFWFSRLRLGVAVVCALIAAGTVAAAPRLTIRDAEFDFGFVPQNVRISHVFWLYSTGDDTVKILQVNPG